jgi:hypothetical protein
MTVKVLMVAFVACDWGQIGQTFRGKAEGFISEMGQS